MSSALTFQRRRAAASSQEAGDDGSGPAPDALELALEPVAALELEELTEEPLELLDEVASELDEVASELDAPPAPPEPSGSPPVHATESTSVRDAQAQELNR
ncbi:hypothetical protein WMF37_40930 [Sorangium sp. So ce291]|uniref:hypothetical protein n=1 Tax=Sorangium sp. So ce291 TaxID=3133294 RepID=UPI003F63EA60